MWHGAALWYKPIERDISHFTYTEGLLFSAHLIFCYIMVALLLFLLVKQLLQVPTGYRRKYLLAIGILLLIVIINALYLFFPGEQGSDYLDYSLLGYSLAALCFYWLAFRFSRQGMANVYHGWVFDSLHQGVLLFDYDDRLIMHNGAAQAMLPLLSLQDEMPLNSFLESSGLLDELDLQQTEASVQFYQAQRHHPRPMKCEYHTLKDRKGRAMGRLFVVSPVLQ